MKIDMQIVTDDSYADIQLTAFTEIEKCETEAWNLTLKQEEQSCEWGLIFSL